MKLAYFVNLERVKVKKYGDLTIYEQGIMIVREVLS